MEHDLDALQATTHALCTVEAHARARVQVELAALAGSGIDLVGAVVQDQLALVDAHGRVGGLHVRQRVRELVVCRVGNGLALDERWEVTQRLAGDADGTARQRQAQHRHRRGTGDPNPRAGRGPGWRS